MKQQTTEWITNSTVARGYRIIRRRLEPSPNDVIAEHAIEEEFLLKAYGQQGI